MKRKTVCVDLDGVLARYDGWKGVDHFGLPLPGAQEFTRRLSQFARVVIFTTRANADPFVAGVVRPDGEVEPHHGATPDGLVGKIEAWLDLHGFHYDEVYAGQGKPLASAYIDDRAVSCEPQEVDGAYVMAEARAKLLCERG